VNACLEKATFCVLWDTLARRPTITVFPSDTETFTARPGKKLSWKRCAFWAASLTQRGNPKPHRGARARNATARTGIIHGAGLRQEARSENDHVVASANGWRCLGTKSGNLQIVSQRGGYGSTIVPKAPQNTQAREGQGTAPGQAYAKRKKPVRHANTTAEGTNRRRDGAFSSAAAVKVA